MGEDQRRARMALREAHGELPERGDPAAGVDQHGHVALVRERDELGHDGLVHAEALGARVELDAARAGVERAGRLGERVVVGRDAAVRDEPVGVRGGRGDHGVVGARVALGLVHREDHAARAGGGERVDELLGLLLEAVRVVAAEVGVRVVEGERPRVLDDPVQPRAHEVVDRRHGWPATL